MANPNNPQKGAIITVDPIRGVKDIRSIKKMLASRPRDLALFVVVYCPRVFLDTNLAV